MSTTRSKAKGPKFVRFFWPTVRALKKLGGSGTPSEVMEIIAEEERIPESQQQERMKGGALRFSNQVYFARQYLVWAGLIASSERGVWTLTDAGRALDSMAHDQALTIFKTQHTAHQGTKPTKQKPAEGAEDANGEEDADEGTYKAEVLAKLRTGLSPKGFEHFCQRLLREYGFERVSITGGPKDKGLDGEGILKINPFMSFRVVFQCKRYAEAVTSSHVSTFRGSIPSSVDKGILMTTGYFTADAIKMAQEPSMKPIELIDGDQIIALLEKLHLGLKPTYTIDEQFFEDFENSKHEAQVSPKTA
jgi:restriction system protein